MIERDGECVLLWRGGQWRWSFAGYSLLQPVIPAEEVNVLTPALIVALFAAGLAAELNVHKTLELAAT